MPAGYGTRCVKCYYTNLAIKRFYMNSHALETSNMKNLFVEFGSWLIKHIGAAKASKTSKHYLDFFIELERRWGCTFDYKALIEHFGAEHLRRYGKAVSWFEDIGLLYVDLALKIHHVEERRIANLLRVSTPSVAAEVLVGYENVLREKLSAGTIKLNSIRLALSPARALIMTSPSSGTKLPNQKALDNYLSSHPGQLAALTGFVNYLNRIYGLSLCFNLQKAKNIRKRRIESQLTTLANEGLRDQQSLCKWARLALEYFHGLKLSENEISILLSTCLTDNNGKTITKGNHKYFIPVPEPK
jgi:hypothetical protein